jgi:hypothetical protein
MEIMPKLKFLQCVSVVFLTTIPGPSAWAKSAVDRSPVETNVIWNVPTNGIPPGVPITPALAGSNGQGTAVTVKPLPLTNGLWKNPIDLVPPGIPITPALAATNAKGIAIGISIPASTNVLWKVPTNFTPPAVPITPALAGTNAKGISVAVSTLPGSNVVWKAPIHFITPGVPITPALAGTNGQGTAVAASELPGDSQGIWRSPTNWTPSSPLQPIYTNGQFQVHVMGTAGQAFVLQTSSDLIHWLPLSTNILAGSPLSLMDTNAGNYTARFYRTVALP